MDGELILLVEDNAPLRAAIQMTLERAGYPVLTAADGAEALQVMEKTIPNLIVADINMPEMDGYAFHDAVRARPEWNRVPFLFLTARAEHKDVLRGKAMGVDDYLTKPVDPQELLIVVRARLERSQALQQSAQAELDQLKEQILVTMGHELRTPLTYIVGYTDLALKEMRTLPPETLEELLTGVQSGGERLTRLVEDLMMLIRLDAGQLAEEVDAVATPRHDLEDIVASVVQQYQGPAADQGVTLALDLEADRPLPPVTLVDSYFIDALGRLVDNGIRFSGGQGKRVVVSLRGRDDQVEIEVSDEGIGISPGAMSHLFQRFQQIDRDRMEQQGLGLGLAIARGLIRLHGGDITAQSTPGEGSTFTIRLPVVTAEA